MIAVSAIPPVKLIGYKVLAACAALQRVGGLRGVLQALHKVGGVLPGHERVLAGSYMGCGGVGSILKGVVKQREGEKENSILS